MNKNIKKIIYYFIIIIMFIVVDKLIYYFDFNDNVLDYVLKEENNNLKDELNKISKLNYNDYDYVIGKITYNNLYNSDSYFIETNEELSGNLVLNDKGLLGIIDNKMLKKVKDLTMSVEINNTLGILKNNKIDIIHGNYQVGDKIYSYNLSNVNQKFLIGYIKNINKLSLKDEIEINYLNINSKYVVILK